jgi:four helix bundle protein
MAEEKVETWKDLQVWQLAHGLVLRVYEMAKGFPTEERFRLTDQLCRAAISIPTNIVEGKGRNSLGEYLQFLSIAKGSVEEVKYLLLLARDLGYIDEAGYWELADGYNQVGKMLNKLIRSLRSHLPPKPQHPKPKTQNLKPKTHDRHPR